MRSFLCSILLVAFFTPALAANSTDDVANNKKQASARAAETLRLAEQEAATFEFHLGTERTTKLKLHPQSILRWSNPVSGELFGEVFIWTANGRPEVVASLHKFYQNKRRHMSGEFHSLSLGHIVAMRDGQRVWFPTRAGVTLQPIRGTQPPGATAAQRVRQMRALARQFSAEATDRNDQSKKEQLRLLPKPIYRYQSTEPKVQDGAIFAFVQGTNPEVLLLIEARKTIDGHQWQYALVRFNSLALRASYKNQGVWSVPKLAPPWENVRDPRKPYWLFMLRQGDSAGETK